jgi:SlyX protein
MFGALARGLVPGHAVDMRELNERLERLEERLAWFERHVTQQDRAMLEMAEEMARLRAELSLMRDRVDGSGGSEAGGIEKPPHY